MREIARGTVIVMTQAVHKGSVEVVSNSSIIGEAIDQGTYP